jgi:hypothetical protein
MADRRRDKADKDHQQPYLRSFMTAKEYLSQYHANMVKIDAQRKLEGIAQGVSDRFGADYEIKQRANEYLALIDTITEQINEMENPVYSEILKHRYIDRHNLLKIADEMRYSYETIRHLHCKALKTFENKYLVE